MAQNPDSILTWSSFWSYFMSPSCTQEMRLDMAKDLRLPEFLENISANAQIEVLEDAPAGIVQSPSIRAVLKLKTIQELGITFDDKQTSSVTLAEVVESIKRKNGW